MDLPMSDRRTRSTGAARGRWIRVVRRATRHVQAMLGQSGPRHAWTNLKCHRRPSSAIPSILIALLLSGSPTAAHDGAAFILLQPPEAAAGDRISAYVDLSGPSTPYRMVLAGVGVEIGLGTVTTDAVGHGSLKLNIPTDLVPGIYAVQAIGPDGLVASTNIAVRERAPADIGLLLGAFLAVVALVLLVAGALGRRSHSSAA